MTRRTHDLDLMQHVDNEVDLAAERADVSGLLETDADIRKKVEALGEMRELVRGHLELAADAVPDRRFESMWREVDKAIGPAREPAPAAPGLWSRISTWFDRYRGHVITGAVSAGAVAALAIVLRPGGEAAIETRGAIDVKPVSLRQPPAIESLDTPDGTGTILNLEDEDGHTAVIWVTPVDIVEGI